MEAWQILLIISGSVISIIIGFLAGINHRKKVAETEIGSAEQEAKRLINEAMLEAEAKKKAIILDGKDEIIKNRSEVEKELSERRKDVQRQEKRLQQREETLDRKIENLDKKSELLEKKEKLVDQKLTEVDELKQNQVNELEKISGLSEEQAKEILLKKLDESLIHEKAVKIKESEQKFHDEAEAKAREIISLAIQRCASDHVS